MISPTGPPFRLTICGIPELDEHCTTGVTHVLSLLDPDCDDPPALTAFAPHQRIALRFHDVIEPKPERIAPSLSDVERLLAFGRELVDAPRGHLLIHCHAGVSRSTAAASLILAQASPDRPARDMFDMVSDLRPRAWPNLRILELGDALLGRDGEIIAAVAAVYRRSRTRPPFPGSADRRRPRTRSHRGVCIGRICGFPHRPSLVEYNFSDRR
jgi:predicted protein tyrosine phosphatase